MAEPRATSVASAGPAERQAASIVALVAGLMFFVPLVAQAIGIVAGVYALSRPRDSGARKGLAGVGLALSLAALGGWGFVFIMISGSSSGVIATAPAGFGPMGPVGASTTVEDDPQAAYTWRELTRRVQKAAVAYRRDYGRWPASVEAMCGRSLPLAFTLPEAISYHPVPDSQTDNPDWILLVSEPTRWSLDAEALARPHRLIQQVNGASALLPAETVAQRLARDDSNGVAPSPKTESSERDDP